MYIKYFLRNINIIKFDNSLVKDCLVENEALLKENNSQAEVALVEAFLF